MTKFIFSGDPLAARDPATQTEFGGVVFPRDEPVAVTDELAERLRAHSHFTEAVEAETAVEPAPKRRGRPRKNP